MQSFQAIRRLSRNQKGYALIAAMAIVVILSIMVMGLSTLALAEGRWSQLWSEKTEAFYLAESGIRNTVYRIVYENLTFSDDRIYPIDAPQLTSEGKYDFGTYKLFEVWVQTLADGKLSIISRGRVNGTHKAVEVILHPPTVFPPPESGPVIETTPTPENQNINYYMPEYQSPDIVITMPEGGSEGSLNLENNAVTTISGNYYYSDVNLLNSSSLTVQGPSTIHVAGDVTFNNNAILTVVGDVTFIIGGNLTLINGTMLVNTDGKVTFYVGQNVTIRQNAALGGDDPTKLLIYLSTENDSLEYTASIYNNAEFIGGLCAPTANVDIWNNAVVDGAVIGREVDIGNNAEVTYDSRMNSVNLNGAGNWNYVGWYEK